jgi:hypothetical protein
MKLKKSLGFFLLAMLIIPSVSAYFIDSEVESKITKMLDGAVSIVSPVFEKVIGEYNSSEFFLTKSLLLILLILILNKILEKTPIGENNKKISLIIAILISIISIRFINENEMIEAILIQYGTLSSAILTILPLMIFFYFLHHIKVGSYGRRIFWMIYLVIMVSLWFSRWDNLNKTSNWIYASVILSIALLAILDKTIHGYFGVADFKKFEKRKNQETIRELKNELIRLEDYLKKKIVPYNEYKKEKQEIEIKIAELSKE